MPQRLKDSPQIWKLVRDLGIKTTPDPIAAILHHCEQRIKKFLADLPGSQTPSQLLDLVAAKLGTVFEVARSDSELHDIRQKYLSRGEKIFSRLNEDLADEVYGITFKLLNREPWELEYVSVIDCRGSKAARAYYTKWHEIAHLLTQTDQMRLSFRRTHCESDKRDPEEALMEVIAGNFGFYSPMVQSCTSGEISFKAIENLRDQLCPEASRQSSTIGMVKAWPKPCLLVQANMALRRGDQALLRQEKFDFLKVPKPALRAIRVTANDAARSDGLSIFGNMRVPERSVIYRVFSGDAPDYSEADEDLSWWETSNGTQLPQRKVRVKTRSSWDSVEALIIPL